VPIGSKYNVNLHKQLSSLLVGLLITVFLDFLSSFFSSEIHAQKQLNTMLVMVLPEAPVAIMLPLHKSKRFEINDVTF
jgi:hypothetical protein